MNHYRSSPTDLFQFQAQISGRNLLSENEQTDFQALSDPDEEVIAHQYYYHISPAKLSMVRSYSVENDFRNDIVSHRKVSKKHPASDKSSHQPNESRRHTDEIVYLETIIGQNQNHSERKSSHEKRYSRKRKLSDTTHKNRSTSRNTDDSPARNYYEMEVTAIKTKSSKDNVRPLGKTSTANASFNSIADFSTYERYNKM